jgi:Calpain large subunit, domain III
MFKVEDEHEGRLDQAFFRQNEPIYDSDFNDSREVARRIQLKVPATYFIVPCTLKPKAQANFILRIFFDKEIEVG